MIADVVEREFFVTTNRLAWTVAIEPERLPRITNTIARPVLDQAAGAMLRVISRQAENHQTR